MATVANPALTGYAPSGELLVALEPLDLPVFVPLRDWASHILGSLARYAPQAGSETLDAHSYAGVSGCFNQAGLIETCFGRMGHAATICELALEWLTKWLPRTGDLSLARLAFQPYINLGRLERITGDTDCALERFAKLRLSTVHRVPFMLGPMRVSRQYWDAMRSAKPAIAGLFVTVSAVESVKTLLKAKRYSAVLEYIADKRGLEDTAANDAFTEAAALAWTATGRPDQALAFIESRLADEAGANYPIFAFRRIETLASSGEEWVAIEASRHLLAKLAGEVDTPGPFRLRVLAQLAGLLAHFDADQALAACAIGLRGAIELNDVRLQMKFLAVRAKADSDEAARSEARSQMNAIQRSGLYGAASTAAGEAGPIEELYMRLTALPMA